MGLHGQPDVDVHQGDLLDFTVDALFISANSFRDSGILLASSQSWSRDLKNRLRDVLRLEHNGERCVGQTFNIENPDARIPFVVNAPTMRKLVSLQSMLPIRVRQFASQPTMGLRSGPQ